MRSNSQVEIISQDGQICSARQELQESNMVRFPDGATVVSGDSRIGRYGHLISETETFPFEPSDSSQDAPGGVCLLAYLMTSQTQKSGQWECTACGAGFEVTGGQRRVKKKAR